MTWGDRLAIGIGVAAIAVIALILMGVWFDRTIGNGPEIRDRAKRRADSLIEHDHRGAETRLEEPPARRPRRESRSTTRAIREPD